jgi:hypothetical protein
MKSDIFKGERFGIRIREYHHQDWSEYGLDIDMPHQCDEWIISEANKNSPLTKEDMKRAYDDLVAFLREVEDARIAFDEYLIHKEFWELEKGAILKEYEDD